MNNSKHILDEKSSFEHLNLQLSKAREIARNAHNGQCDKAHQPYFLHPDAVSQIVIKNIDSQASSEEFKIHAMIVSYLHDVIEDTSITVDDLRKQEIPEVCIQAIETLTKKEGQDYWEYLSEIKRNELARVVKIADMMHNSNLSRLNQITDVDRKRRKKYLEGITFLNTD